MYVHSEITSESNLSQFLSYINQTGWSFHPDDPIIHM